MAEDRLVPDRADNALLACRLRYVCELDSDPVGGVLGGRRVHADCGVRASGNSHAGDDHHAPVTFPVVGHGGRLRPRPMGFAG
ncbi:MAG: hypothetical protein QY305_08270 [Candidatus Brocadiaceae baterium WH-1]|nr:MAG: hypothetical protein QY305_08270 [Candidatus Jettenia sp. AMX2]